MKIAHSVDQRQVENVLTQFEATTSAIRGIDEKVARVNGYVAEMRMQRERLTKQAETVTGLVDSMSNTLNLRSDDILMFFTDTLDNFACLVEKLEQRLLDLRLQDAPRQFQREFGPLLVPAVVLVIIITVSNCVFGFLLAGDAALSDSFSILQDETLNDEQPLNILKLFAVLHMALIGAAVLFVIVEAVRKICCQRRRGRSSEHGALRIGIAASAATQEATSHGSRSSKQRLSARLSNLSRAERYAQEPGSSPLAAHCRQRVAELRMRRHSWMAGDVHIPEMPLPLQRLQSNQSSCLSYAPDVGAGTGLDIDSSSLLTTSCGGRPLALPATSSEPLRRMSGGQTSNCPSQSSSQAWSLSPRSASPRGPERGASPSRPEVNSRSPASPASGISSPPRSREGRGGNSEAGTRQSSGSERGHDFRGRPPAATPTTPIAYALRRFQSISAPIAERLLGVDESAVRSARRPGEPLSPRAPPEPQSLGKRAM